MSILRSVLVSLITYPLFASCSQASSSGLSDTEKAMVFLMLSQTNELRIHQLKGATENEVFLHRDGHKEAVYNADGNLVQDGLNDGDYNYAHPKNDPFGHFDQDIHPWILMGRSPNDPSSQNERIYAYVLDLEGGVVRARELWAKDSQRSLAQANADAKLPKPWSKVLKQPETKSLFEFIAGESDTSDENLIATLDALYEALNQVY